MRSRSCALILAVLSLATARADEVAARRLTAAFAAIDEAPQVLPALVRELGALEGLRLDAGDVAAARGALAGRPRIAPLLQGLGALAVEGGLVRMTFERPVVFVPRPEKKVVISFEREATFRVRSGADGSQALEDVRGVRVGHESYGTFELRELVVADEGARSVGRAAVRLGFLRKVVRVDLGPANGLTGAIAR